MNITTDPTLDPVATRAVDEINAKRPQDEKGEFIDPPLDALTFLTDNANALLRSWKAAQDDADRAALAADPRLMALGAAVAAQPDKFDAVEKAVVSILQA